MRSYFLSRIFKIKVCKSYQVAFKIKKTRVICYALHFIIITIVFFHWRSTIVDRCASLNVNLSRKRLNLTVSKYIIPYIRGQGLNNQLWEYRSSAIIAKATNRVLCLEPFHRFYLQKTGLEFIPFHYMFDTEKLKNYVQVETDVRYCRSECMGKIDYLIEFSPRFKLVHEKNPFPIADWRPGSLSKFKRSTGFGHLPVPKIISADKFDLESLADINKTLSSFSSSKCVAVAGTIPVLGSEYLMWSRSLEVAQNIKLAVKEVQKYILGAREYLAIHWRFEETKCAGMGKGIGFGRAAGKQVNMKNKIIRASDEHADLCFFAGLVPEGVGASGTWLRLVSKNAIVRWIKAILREHQLDHVYLATDCHDRKLLDWIKAKTGAKTKSELLPTLSQYISEHDNDIVSRVEQQLCTEAKLFAGTLMSSWTSSVIEERFKNHESFFIQDKYKHIRRPDPDNRTFYIDVEACNCDWE